MAAWALTAASVSAVPIPTPQDDVVLAVEGETIEIRDRILLLNDGLTQEGLDIWSIQILESPEGSLDHGTLEQGVSWNYVAPTHDLDASDSFTYTLTDGIAQSPPATVTVHLTPPVIPLSGRWRTLLEPNEACLQGDSEQLGWYDAVAGEFHLCELELDGARLEHCQRLVVPSPKAGERPLIGDWDGDSFDDVALHDPSSGFVRFFTIDHGTTCPDLDTVATLVPGTAYRRPGNLRQAVSGAWASVPTSPGETLGFFDPAAGTFELVAHHHGHSTASMVPLSPTAAGDPAEMVQAVSRPRVGEPDQVGYFQRLTHQIRLLDHGVLETLDPQVEAELTFGIDVQPVLGRWSPRRGAPESAQYWAGFFVLAPKGSPEFASYFLLRDHSPALPDDDPRMPRYVQVVVDPPKAAE